MDHKVMLGDFIYQLRKDKNLSQSQLGEWVGVSNKAVSKWETLEANPDLQVISKLAEVLGVTADELLSCKKAEPHGSQAGQTYLGVKGVTEKGDGYFEFTSEKKTKNGTPYVHVNLGKEKNGKIRKANGVIALGIISKGILSFGFVSYGIVSFGLITFGLVALGAVGIGLLVGLGAIAIGVGVSAGGLAVGTVAVGGATIGIVSVGGLSLGIWSHTGEFGKAIGHHTFIHK